MLERKAPTQLPSQMRRSNTTLNRRRPLSSSYDDQRIGGAVFAPVSLQAASALFHSLSDETRLAILRRLACGEARVVDLTGELGLAQSTVSAHLGCLRECGLVDYRPQGRSSVYRLARPEVLAVFTAAEDLLAATGNAVALCSNYGHPDGHPETKRKVVR